MLLRIYHSPAGQLPLLTSKAAILTDRLDIPDPTDMSHEEIVEYVTGVVTISQYAATQSLQLSDARPVNFGWIQGTGKLVRTLVPIDIGVTERANHKTSLSHVANAASTGFPTHIATAIKLAILAAKRTTKNHVQISDLKKILLRCFKNGVRSANSSIWPQDADLPPVASTPIEAMLRMITSILCTPWLNVGSTSLRYNRLQAANQCERYIPDLVLNAACS